VWITQNPVAAGCGTEKNCGAVGFALRKNQKPAGVSKIHRFRFHFLRAIHPIQIIPTFLTPVVEREAFTAGQGM